MKIGILSDTHDRVDRIELALSEFHARGVERLIHCGDITDAKTVVAFDGWMIDFVFGNCDWNPARLEAAMVAIGATLHKQFGYLELAGAKIAWTHGDDADKLHSLETANHFDFVFYGHTHVAEQHRVGKSLVVNPGALQRAKIKQCVVLSLPVGELESIMIE